MVTCYNKSSIHHHFSPYKKIMKLYFNPIIGKMQDFNKLWLLQWDLVLYGKSYCN